MKIVDGGSVIGAAPPERRLRTLVLRGSAWTAAGYGASQVLRLGNNLILTRLLVPDAFGMMMLVQLFIQGLQMFSDVGIGPSIIRHKKGDDPAFLNTAWTLQIVRGAGLWVAASLLSWPVAAFYGQPKLAPLMIAAALGVVISGFNSTSLFSLNRGLALGRLTTLDLISQAVGSAAMIGWALISPSVWALVGGGLVSAAVKMAASHRLHEHRNRFAWDPEARESLITFGRAVAVSTAVTFLANQCEQLILGRFVSLSLLGVYGVGCTMARFGTMILQQIMSKVLFPSIAQVLREDPDRAIQHYRRIRTVVDSLAVTMAFVLIPFGPALLRLLYDSRYREAGWMFQILIVQAAFDLMRAPASWLLLAAGKPRYNIWAGLARVAVLCIGLPLAFWLKDMTAGVWVIAISSAPSFVIFSWGIGSTFPALRAGEWISGTSVSGLVLLSYVLFA